MKFAVITDVHADVHALRDALTQIDRLGCETILCCGDLVDYGLFPEETIQLLQQRGVVTIRGNHDRWVREDPHGLSGGDLTDDARDYLAALPAAWDGVFDGVRVVLTHGQPGNDMRGVGSTAPGWKLAALLDETRATLLFVGHTHVPFIRRVGLGGFVVNPGALLRDPGPGVDVPTPGTFAFLEVAQGEGVLKIEIRRAAVPDVVAQYWKYA